MKRAFAVVVVTALGLLGCGSSASKTTATSAGPAASGTAVTIQNFAFSPSPLSAKVGDTVTVTNKDNTNHTFTADDNSFDTGPFSSGSKTVKLTKTGTLTYHCNIHSFMHGTINAGS
jgi:plastocyanin